MGKKTFVKTLLFALLGNSLPAQDSQFWADYMLNHPFANSFNLENTFVYSTLSASPRWRSFEYTPTLDYSLTYRVDFTFACNVVYTDQSGDYNTLEIRPAVGTRIHFTPHKRVLTRLYLRVEDVLVKVNLTVLYPLHALFDPTVG